MATRALVIFLLCTGTCFGQYKHFLVGINYSRNSSHKSTEYNTPDNFLALGLNMQYNTRSVLSVSFEPVIEKMIRYYNYTDYTLPHPDWFDRYETFTSDRLSIPVLAKVTFGDKLLLKQSFGASYSVLLPSSSYHKVDYNFMDEEKAHPMNEETYKVNTKGLEEFNLIYGAGLAYSFNDRILVGFDARFPIRKVSSPAIDDRGEYSSYPRPRIILSISYQFNAKKESNYSFSNYYLKLTKTTNGN